LSLGNALCSRLVFGFEFFEGRNELLDVAPSLNTTKLLLRFDNRGADPADDHRSPLPSLHVLRVARDPAAQVFDCIRIAELLAEHSGDSERLQRERFIEPFFD
jgi:hypothetical protein